MGHVMGNSTKVKRKKVSTYAHRCVVYFCLEHGAPNVQLQFSYQESEEKKKKERKKETSSSFHRLAHVLSPCGPGNILR